MKSPTKVTSEQRQEMGRIMDLLVRYEPKVHYAQIRPMPTRTIKNVKHLESLLKSPAGIKMDCSESVTLICRLAGLKDPNGRNYDGYGNTETLYANLPHYYNGANASCGALFDLHIEHVCMVRKHSVDPVLFSHGQEVGPIWIRASIEKQYHRPPYTYLNISGLGGE